MNLQSGFGKCPACNEWNTFFEQKLSEKQIADKKTDASSVELKTVEYKEVSRISTGFGELDRVLRWRNSWWITNTFRWRARYWKIDSYSTNM